MMSKVLSAAVLAAIVVVGQAAAQTVAGVGLPRELPPAGYTQQQYVDSRGCVFLRAGLGGNVRWVPRVGADRKPLCGATPTFEQARDAAAALDAQAPVAQAPTAKTGDAAADTMTATAMPAPAASARVPLAPAATVAAMRAPDLTIKTPAVAPLPSPITAVQPPLTLAAVPAPTVAPVLPTGTPSGNRIACFKSAPVLQRVALNDGGSALVCTRGDGSLSGWRAPVFPGKSVVGATLSPPAGQSGRRGADSVGAAMIPEGRAPVLALTAPALTAPSLIDPASARVAAAAALPKGYVQSWKDDRLNPMRGLGTAQGQAQQDAVWTRDIPAEPVTIQDGNRLVFVSSKSANVATPRQPAASDVAVAATVRQAYIQVGAFADPANASGAAARLSAAGLPVASQAMKGLKVILAGPFATMADAGQALGAVRGAGFRDAFIR